MSIRIRCGVALATLALAAPIGAQSPSPDSMLVSTAWLAQRLGDKSVIVLTTGNPADYDGGHIPGTRFLPWQSFAIEKDGLHSQLADDAQLADAFANVGVTDGARLVVYGAPVAAARVFMTLQYMGYAGRVSMLDGGLPAWKAEARAVTTDKPTFAKGSVTVRPRSDVVVDRAYVFENLHTPSVHILDARDPQFYEGRNEPNPMSARPGHILGANSIPYSSLLGELNHFKDRAVLDSMFRAAGAKPGERVVTYCHIGMQGSLLYFAARMLGYDARLYDGSYEEWSNRPELPIVASAKTDAKAARPQ